MLKVRHILVLMGIALGVAIVAVVVALYALQTTWFKQQVRHNIIAAAQQASGGHVEIGAFNYHWRTLTAEFTDFVVHGTESATSPPLFRAASVRVRLRLVSILRQDVDIALLKLDRPQLRIQVSQDGTTNMRASRLRVSASQIVDQLLKLRVRRFEFQNGVVQVNDAEVPIRARVDDLSVALQYEGGAPGYAVSLASRDVHLTTTRLRDFTGNLKLAAHLERDRVVVDNLVLASGTSILNAHGELRDFARPTADFNLNARVAVPELTIVTSFPGLQQGELEIKGTIRYDGTSGARLDGSLSGQDVRYHSPTLELNVGHVNTNVFATSKGIRLNGLVLSALGGAIRGDIFVQQDGGVQFSGNFAGLNTREVVALDRIPRLPWSGFANGNLQLSGTMGKRNFALHATAHVTPSRSGVPITGEIDVFYRQPAETLIFGNSHVSLPHTKLSFSGTADKTMQVSFDTTDAQDFSPILPPASDLPLPAISNGGNIHFQGTVSGPISNPYITGELAASEFELSQVFWPQAHGRVNLAEGGIDFSNFSADSSLLHIAGKGHLQLKNWTFSSQSAVRLNAQFQNADLAKIPANYLPWKWPFTPGTASGTFNVSGSISDPRGVAHLNIENLDAYGERINGLQFDARFQPNALEIAKGTMRAGPAFLSFSGTYAHAASSWKEGQLSIKADSNGFPLGGVSPVRQIEPRLRAQMEVHARATLAVSPDHIVPADASGTILLRDISIGRVPYGSLTARAGTQGKLLNVNLFGTLRGARVSGTSQIQLVENLPSDGEVHLERIGIPLLYALATTNPTQHLPLDGWLAGGINFSGPLEHPEQLRGTLQLSQIELTSAASVAGETRSRAADVIFRNSHPIVLDAADGIATIRSFEVNGTDTTLGVRGRIPYLHQTGLDLLLRGAADLRILQLFDPNLRSAGQSTVAASVTGALSHPAINGALQLHNGSFSLSTLPIALTAVNGTINFNGDRATIQDLSAETGGGGVSLAGFVTYGGGLPVYHLDANAANVRVRYAGTSATATADLRLAGTSDNSVLSGNVIVSRIAFNPNSDAGTLLASAAAQSLAPASEADFFTGLQLDVHIQSAADLQVSTALSRDLEGEIDLRLRGTPQRPILLGTASINQGNIRVFGTKYTINRGEVSFVNPVKIEPVLNLDLQTQTRGISVDITISGTIGKLNINYRSDPPLQPRDIIALLTVGHTPDIAANISGAPATSSDVSALQSNANTVFGAAIAPSSGALQKLFGVANVRIDPMVEGITNTMQRLTIEQQISRDITVTYVTNLSETSEQIFRFEWAFSPQYSVVALRDDNGEFGIDFQYKKRF